MTRRRLLKMLAGVTAVAEADGRCCAARARTRITKVLYRTASTGALFFQP